MKTRAAGARRGAALLVLALLVVGGASLALAGGVGRFTEVADPTQGSASPIAPVAPPPMRSVSLGEHSTVLAPGDAAIVRAQAPPGSACGIVVLYGPGPPKAPELVDKVADARGVVEWTWRLHQATPRGRWPVIVICRTGDHEEEDGYYLRVE